jgi:predicted nucleic-acid-binding Zn-ribbon protein
MASDAPQQRSDRILKSLTSKGLRGCPVCSKGQFSVGPEHVIISTPGPETAEGALVEGSAVVPVMCANCGYTMLFSPRKLPEQGE